MRAGLLVAVAVMAACGPADDVLARPSDTTAIVTAHDTTADAGAPDPQIISLQPACDGCWLACVTGQPCTQDLSGVPGPGQTEMFLLGQSPGPFAASSVRITSPPWHGVCFVGTGQAEPSWCDAISASGLSEVAVPPDLEAVDPVTCEPLVPGATGGVLVDRTASSVYANAALEDGGSLAGSWTVCSLQPGGYVCLAARSMGDAVGVGHLGDPEEATVYVLGLQAYPDVSPDSPEPLQAWRAPNRRCSLQVE